MRRVVWLILIAVAATVLLVPAEAMAQATGRNGTVAGTVTDPDGAPLPGVSVTINGDTLIQPQTGVTGMDGRYRVPALPPGTYVVSVALDGFNPMQQEDIRVNMGSTQEVNFTLAIGGLEESVTVVGDAPLVDVKGSSANSTTFSDDYLDALPTNRSNSGASDFLGMAPGANVGDTDRAGGVTGRGASALGGTNQGTQFAYDGVMVNSAEGGEVEMQMDVDNVAEASFGGVGAPAEVGGYSGMIVNLATKSGGPSLQGTANFFLRADGWNAQNSDDPQFIQDVNNNKQMHFDIGGPLAAGKVWGYGSFRRSNSNFSTDVSGGETGFNTRTSFFGKATWQMSPKDRLQVSYQHEWENGKDAADLFVRPEAVFEPWGLWRTGFADYLRVFNSDTVLEVHAGVASNASSDFPGATDINPNTEPGALLPPGHIDEVTGVLSESPGFFFDRTRNRYQVNASISHYADEFLGGSHDFKAGIQSSIDPTRTHTGYTGGAFYVDYDGEPLYKYEVPSQNDQPKNKSFSFYAQDSWTLAGDRLTVNPGVRVNVWEGCGSTDIGPATGFGAQSVDFGCIFKPKTGIAPRLGVTYDVFGDGTTALKGHYGKYYSQIITSMYLAPGESLFQAFAWNGDEFELDFTEFQLPVTPVDPNIKMSHFNEFSIAIERQLSNTVGIELTYINRRTNDFQDFRLGNGQFANVTGIDPVTGTSYDLWDHLNPDEQDLLNTNPENLPILSPFGFNGFSQSRKYDGVGLSIDKRFSNNWMANASYFYGRTRGTDDTDFENGRGSALGPSRNWIDPNNHFNADGSLSGDRPHNIKVTASGQIGRHISVGGFFWMQSGTPYQRTYVFRDVEVTGRTVRIFAEERGARRLPNQSNLDLRAEGRFRIGRATARVALDIFNIFNSGTVTSVETEDDPFSDEENAFESVRDIRFPRNIRLGFIVNF
jgi:hypothetical protein